MRLVAFLLTTLLAVTQLPAQENPADSPKPQDKMHKAHTFRKTVTRDLSLDYVTFLPEDYEKSGSKKWPLILFLHGAGERGTNVWRVTFHGPSKYIAQHPDFPFILVAPQCPPKQIWENEPLLALLDEVEKKYRVDKKRIYLTGLSMGGYGTWELGVTHPERFAAIAPICGGGRRINVILAGRGYTPDKGQALKSLPVWAFHGARDPVVPLSESEQMIEAFKEAKADMTKIKFTVYPEAQHDAWTETYNNPELYEWFLQHHR